MSDLSIIPLGGVEEIGKNMMVIEYGEDIIVIDAGIAFPGPELLGIDLIIPDFSYLRENRSKIKAFFITHGHEDHIGALAFVLKEFNVPIYATKLTIGLIQRKLTEHNISNSNLIEINTTDKIAIGVFTLEFFEINHSIPDGIGLIIDTPEGILVHTGDFKIDYTPIDGRLMDFAKLCFNKKNEVLCLICDSTGADKAGFTGSEKIVGEELKKEFKKAKGRIIVATFATNIHRIQQIVDAAKEDNRKIAVVGRSMVNVSEVARELGYLKCPEDMLIELNDIKKHRSSSIVIITTGSQGEPLAALTKIANNSHRQIVLQKDDTVIISASPIPGNVKSVYNTIDKLMKAGANVVYQEITPIHVSGHASQQELKLIISMVKPKYVLPFHGEYKHLVSFSKIAQEVGIPEQNVIFSAIGDRVSFSKGKVKRMRKVPSGRVLIDGLGIGDVGTSILKERKQLAENGLVTIVSVIGIDGNIYSGPEVFSKGFVINRDCEKLFKNIENAVKKIIVEFDVRQNKNYAILKEKIRKYVDNTLYSKAGQQPIIIPLIIVREI